MNTFFNSSRQLCASHKHLFGTTYFIIKIKQNAVVSFQHALRKPTQEAGALLWALHQGSHFTTMILMLLITVWKWVDLIFYQEEKWEFLLSLWCTNFKMCIYLTFTPVCNVSFVGLFFTNMCAVLSVCIATGNSWNCFLQVGSHIFTANRQLKINIPPTLSLLKDGPTEGVTGLLAQGHWLYLQTHCTVRFLFQTESTLQKSEDLVSLTWTYFLVFCPISQNLTFFHAGSNYSLVI